MGFNFPNTPTSGQTYTPAGGPTFAWDGVAWKSLTSGVPVTVYVNDTPPVSPAPGQLYWESDTGNLYIWYSDGDSAQWVQVNGTPGGYQTAQARNRIVNGAMQISQENSTAGGSTSGYYAADQWMLTTVGLAAGAAALGQDVVSDVTGLPYIVAIPGAALATVPVGAHWMITTNVEGNRINDFNWGTAVGKQVVLRFFVMGNVAGTYGVSIRNTPGSLNHFVGTFEITAAEALNYASATWSEKTIVIPPPPVGSVWGSGTTIGLQMFFALALGSDKTGAAGWSTASRFSTSAQVNVLSATANRFRLRGVGLYADPLNTGVAPPWTMPDEAEELQACRRYFALFNTQFVISGVATAGAQNVHGYFPFQGQMRVAPSAATFATPINSNSTGIALGAAGLDGLRGATSSSAAGPFYAIAGAVAVSARM